MDMIFVGDIVESNGMTVKQNNLAKHHNIKIGELVEVKYHEWYGEGACEKLHSRLWVISHDRDCDGTPLYGLSRFKTEKLAFEFRDIRRGFAEESLTVVPVTEELKYGEGALEWE